jgi:oxygen-independent coproporphyrinogen-3 oxidase
MAGIYLHIPFCKQACYYCDFHFSTSMKMKEDFTEVLLKELILQRDYLKDEAINTVYFGGGTPSLLSYDDISELLDTIYMNYNVNGIPEITLEANPDDLSNKKLKELSKTKVNRLSIGVQSFDDKDLRFMNRAHTANEAENCIKNAQDIGFENLTADLIYGTPTLSDEQWKSNLNKLNSLDIPHLSCYCLTVESKTALADFIRKGKAPDVDEQKSATHFEIMLEEMDKYGYDQYEISNFCKEGKFSEHNTAYWFGEKYLGLGPSAHSYNGTTRQWNVSNNPLYIKSINENKIPYEIETLTNEQRFNEYILTSLRTKWGTDINKVEKDFGTEDKETLMNQVMNYLERGLIIKKDNHFFLTNKGKLIADTITSDLFL